jgi:3-hydroxyisobutyrate dehydrogenase-like beta-hydroxyacid dehydrogenase
MTEAIRSVGILSPGDMGSAVGRVLHSTDLEVLTALEGRSQLTRERSAAAGFKDTGDLEGLVRQCDVVLSILVPSEAVAVAESVADAMHRTGARPVFVECNAIAPHTVRAIEKTITSAGGTFIDAGIIGGPPRAPGANTRFYCSGPDTSAFEALAPHGIDVRVVGSGIGQASGLKMVYAASTKGTTALWTELLVAARALGLQDALLAEFGEGHSLVRQQMNGIPSMPRRAKRWVGEMEEIAATFGALGLTPSILLGAADMYRYIGDTPLGAQTSRDPDPSVTEVLETLVSHLPALVEEAPRREPFSA